MKVLASSEGIHETTVDSGPVYRRENGVFEVPDAIGKAMKRGGEWGVVGTTFRSAKGHLCLDCGRVNVFKDQCGKCKGTNLKPDE